MLAGFWREEHANIASPPPPLVWWLRSTMEGPTSSWSSRCRRVCCGNDGRDDEFAIVVTADTPEHMLEGNVHVK